MSLDSAVHAVVRVDGHLASVWTEYSFFVGGKLSHCGVDALQIGHKGYGVDRIVGAQAVARLEKLGLLATRGSWLAVTPRGRLLLDSILGGSASSRLFRASRTLSSNSS